MDEAKYKKEKKKLDNKRKKLINVKYNRLRKLKLG